MQELSFKFSAKVWVWPGPSPWHFVNLPENLSKELIEMYGHLRAGFGSLPVSVTLKNATWQTSIFPDSRTGTFMLPLKKEIRKKTGLTEGGTGEFELRVRD